MTQGYRARDVAELLNWPLSRVYSYIRSELIQPERDRRGYVFVFQDLVVLRAARALIDQQVSARRVKRTLVELRQRLSDGRPLSALSLATAGDRIVVRDGDVLWEPETGQGHLDLDSATQKTTVPTELGATTYGVDSDAAYDQGVESEEADSGAAIEAYRRAIELEDRHADAHINLGRLLQQQGQLDAALNHYQRALSLEPNHAIAHFNLGTLLEDRGYTEQAITHYLKAAPQLADAHINLARLYESRGDRAGVIRHLRAVRLW